MKKLLRVLVAGVSAAGILAGVQLYSGQSISPMPSLIGFAVAALAALALVNLRVPGGDAVYRGAVVLVSLLLLGVLFGVSMGGGPVTAGSFGAGIALIGFGAAIMWPVTVIGIAAFVFADLFVARKA